MILKKELYYYTSIIILILTSCLNGPIERTTNTMNSPDRKVYADSAYAQNFSIKYYLSAEQQNEKASAISCNRDGQIRVLLGNKLIVPDNGSLFYSGKFIQDVAFTQMLPKQIKSVLTYKNQTVYLDQKQIFSNAWAGKLQIDHSLPESKLFAAGPDFQFLISDGNNLQLLNENSEVLWKGSADNLIQLKYQEKGNRFILVSPNSVKELTSDKKINQLYTGSEITCAEPLKNGEIAIGTTKGYLVLPGKEIITKLPSTNISCISELEGDLWFGSDAGAFRLDKSGKYDYYAYERWLPGSQVIALEKGPDKSVLVLTDKGLGQICSQKMTLEDKALFFEKQVREKNIRYGINSSSVRLVDSYSSAQTGNQPSDNLWTGMYLASQMFRYKVTGSAEAKENAYESFEAIERMHTVTGIKGLFARSFERDYILANTKTEGWQQRELVSGSPALLWLPAKDHPNWTWRSTASSDQTVGQIFGLTTILELSDDEALKARALKCLDNLMNYIVDNNFYIIDVDGQPTMWGKWNPEYVNKFPTNVGDRKICSSNIIAFLQTAYHFTKNEKYKTKAFELMEKYGYLDNLTRSMKEIGPNDNDPVSKSLSEEWNHSDDEMYFLAYWGLYPYAFNEDLQKKFGEAIRDHWDIERPEKNALWNFTYAMTGAKNFDLDQSISFLKEYPIDLRNWTVKNSQRKDIELIPANFRGQTTKELLPLSEMPLYRHNGQIFRLDNEGDGKSLISAGDVWLLPYWMGRYLGVISAPIKK